MKSDADRDWPAEPAQAEGIDIEALCATLDPAEKPELVDFGPPVGSEVW